MASKDNIPDPIDRPLASSYSRGFDGWSTAYPPELSAPSSLRKMENVYITPEAAVRIRPGLRSIFTKDYWLGDQGLKIVGGFEHFMSTQYERGMLVAVRKEDGTIIFKTFQENLETHRFDEADIFPGLENIILPASVKYIKYLQIDNRILALPSDTNYGAILFNVGLFKTVKDITSDGLDLPKWTDTLRIVHPSNAWINGTQDTTATPAAETASTETLIHSSAAENEYNFAYYYTMETDFGETAASNLTVVRASRSWSQWLLNVPNASGGKGAVTNNPKKAMDQLVAILPNGIYEAAKQAGAIKWNLYMLTWADNQPIPPTGLLVATQPITAAGDAKTENWVSNTAAALANSYNTPVPTEENRTNYSQAPTAMQGLVAGERLILVNDSDGRIKWSSNIPGEYINFSPSKNGGVKTLSAGNLEIPISAKLWQNPQATDSVVILCSGLDGQHSAYYMAPAVVSGQSDSTSIMGFEETTATPGTTSPYGVEVFNNALYHPLEHTLMKSTAQNYNISHKNMTDDISNMWRRLINKDKIVSAQMGDYIYYIVHNPLGEPLQDGCLGNEIWVLAPTGDNPGWSRWLIQGLALNKIEIDNFLYMTVTTPDAVFILDPYSYADEKIGKSATTTAPIPWKFETNAMGASTKKDTYSRLQLATLSLGDWGGKMKWGLRGYELEGRPMDISKIFQGNQTDPIIPTPNHLIDQTRDLGDTKDVLEIRGDLSEWTVFCESIPGEYSYGQVNLARFQFVTLSLNVGYSLGSTQTAEYARNVGNGNDYRSQNGIPRPITDPRRP